MNVFKGRNIPAVVSSVVFGLLGIIIVFSSKGTILNIAGIVCILLAIIGFANYVKYSVVLDADEIRTTGLFKGKKVKYKNIVKIFSGIAGKTHVTYIIDKYNDKGKWFIRGTYPPKPLEQLGSANFDDLSEVISINSYTFPGYKEMLKQLSKRVSVNCDIDEQTWYIINS